MKRILHIVSDEKIIDRTIEYFEQVYPERNDFIVIVKDKEASLRYIKKKHKIQKFTLNDKTLKKIGNDDFQYEHIIVHMLNDIHVKFINMIKHPNITWINWGADLYNGFLVPKGYKLYRKSSSKFISSNISNLRRILRPIAKLIDKRRLNNRKKALNKLRNIAINDVDLELLNNYYPKTRNLNRVSWFYYPIDSVLGPDLQNKWCNGNKIILGNSASPTGNHIEILQLLNKRNISQDIIVPLSYGDSFYRSFIISQSKDYNNLKLSFLLDYLPLDEYNKILLNCGNYIYGNLRQEAVGNINIGIYLGAKIFLDIENPLFKFYTNMGIKIFSTEDISEESLSAPLSQEERRRNREIISEKYNYNRLIRILKESFPLLMK